MDVYTTRTTCRLCGGPHLDTILDFGEQRLQGQFPRSHEPDPPLAPLELVRCRCGLVQLRHTVDPARMFSNYHYRSSVSETMRAHLQYVATQASAMLAPTPGLLTRILDIACNDNTLLAFFRDQYGDYGAYYGVDPSDVPPAPIAGIQNLKGFFPATRPPGKFDLVTTLACLYDLDDPVSFARGVAEILQPDGLWCVEVADLGRMFANTAFDAVCHEHLTYLSPYTMSEIARPAGLKIVRAVESDCNGGSVRYYLAHKNSVAYDREVAWKTEVGRLWSEARDLAIDPKNERHAKFATDSLEAISALSEFCHAAKNEDKTLHLLGASTKFNTVLQAARLGPLISAASDRDLRKVGRRTPGTNIPILSEADSRAAKPDHYLTVLPFRDEIVARERAAGSKSIVFCLPKLEVVDL